MARTAGVPRVPPITIRRLWRALAGPVIVALVCAGAAVPAFAQSRTVIGKVTDSETGEPLVGAQVSVKGTTRGALARDDGTFSLVLQPQDATLVVRRIGYPMKEVAVTAAMTSVTISMQKDVLKLDQVVVTGQASSISRRNLANSVASVDAQQITEVPAASIEHALQGKIAGAQIQQNTGAPGGGDRIRLRGISSILGNAQPLYVVDGVLVSDVAIPQGTNLVSKASGSGIAVASQESPVNRIADLDPNDIENVEVLKGAAAAAIYGSKASGGVIMITTKRGRAGAPQFSLRSGVGTSQLAYKNGSRHFQSLADAMQAFGTRTPDFWAQAWNPNNQFDYEQLIFGRTPLNHETALSVSGGSENTRYFVSGLVHRDEGIVKNTFFDKQSLRINVDQAIASRVTASLGTELLRTMADRGLFGNDNAGNSIYYTVTKLPSFFDFRPRADGTYPVNPFYPSNPFQTLDLFQNREGVWRSITTGKLQYEALSNSTHQLRFIATGGGDVLTQHNFVYSPPELQYEQTSATPGVAVNSFGQNLQYNVNLNAVHVYTPGGLSLTSQLGTQYEVKDLDVTRGSSQNLLGGLSEINSGTVRGVDETRLHVQDFGIFGQAEALFAERFLLTAGMRSDRSSNNGNISKLYFFPKFASSYRMPQLRPGVLDEIKLRVAYGETGNQPQYGQKFTALNTGSISGNGGFTLGGTRGFAAISPERQRELEGGFDATLLGSRAQLEVTAFERNISDLLIQHTLAPTTGFANEVYNGAGMRVRGFETVLSAFPIQNARGLTWNTHVNFATNRSTITKLPVPSFFFGSPQVGAVKIELGKSATQLIGNDTLASGASVPVVMGDGNPDYNLGFSNDFHWKGFSFGGTLDRQHGGMTAAGTWRHFDLGQNSVDYDAPGPGGKKLGKWRTDTYLKLTRIYYQDASYWKLRELTLSYDVPKRYIPSVFGNAEHAQITASGRNLKTWTKFRGSDPDFANFGAGNVPDAVQRERELAAYPPSRSFWLQFSVGF